MEKLGLLKKDVFKVNTVPYYLSYNILAYDVVQVVVIRTEEKDPVLL